MLNYNQNFIGICFYILLDNTICHLFGGHIIMLKGHSKVTGDSVFFGIFTIVSLIIISSPDFK